MQADEVERGATTQVSMPEAAGAYYSVFKASGHRFAYEARQARIFNLASIVLMCPHPLYEIERDGTKVKTG